MAETGNKPKITVLLGDPTLSDATKREGAFHEEDIEPVRRMQAALEELGQYELTYLNDHATMLETLRGAPPELVLNFCDTGFRNQATLEWHIPAFLELHGIPCSGAGPAAMVLAYDKRLVHLLAESLGVAVPREAYFRTPQSALEGMAHFPALIKPNLGDGSVGITQHAVVRDREQARAYLEYFAEALPGREVLVQEFLAGEEVSIGMIGNPGADLRPLPALEVDFSGLPAGAAPILAFESKAVPDSPYWSEIRFHPAKLDPVRLAPLVEAATILFQRLGLRDYGRFDFRADSEGTFRLLEVNPNPAWSYDGKLALMAGLANLSYQELLRTIVETARARIARG